MTLRYILLTTIFASVVPAIHAAENGAEARWNKCEAKVSAPQEEVGVAGGAAAVLVECGKRPVVKTTKGDRLLLSDCNWLYNQPLHECTAPISKDSCNTNDDMDMFSMSSWRGMFEISNKVFNKQKFFKLCRQTCLSKDITPDRATFGKMICGE